jgi:hypothetical protein
MKKVIGILIIILGYVLALYVGLWLLFILPIIDIAKHIDAGKITAMMIVINVIKILLASVVGGVIAYIGTFVGSFLIESDRY